MFFTQLASDNFHRANEFPLDPANWSLDTFVPPDPGLAVLSDFCVVNPLVVGGGFEVYTGISFPNDQYAAATVQSFGLDSIVYVYIRASSDLTTSFYLATFDANGDGSANVTLNDQSGNISAVTISAVNPGDVLLIGAIGTSIFVQYNGVEVLSTTSSSALSGATGLGMSATATQADTQVSLFTAGGVSNVSAYSVPDCRNYGNFPNSSRDVNDTLIYDVQTSSNPDVPGTDSRTAGAPVDSRVTPNIPLNSRTPGLYGPGE